MKKLYSLALIAASLAGGAAMAQTTVGVSIGINQPGVYGRINIGNYPQPVLVAPQPIIVAPQPMAVVRQPIYLYVPPMQQQNWGRYCRQYNACGQPVYFVQEQWVQERYAQEHPGWRGEGHGHGRGDRGEGRGREGRGDRDGR